MAAWDSVDAREADIIQLMPSESCKPEIFQHFSDVLEVQSTFSNSYYGFGGAPVEP
jgi:hypothetical protein